MKFNKLYEDLLTETTSIIALDNGGKTKERYIAIKGNDVYTLSDDDQDLNNYLGTIRDLKYKSVEEYVKFLIDIKKYKKIKLKDIPLDVDGVIDYYENLEKDK